jgi:hypothetical protein
VRVRTASQPEATQGRVSMSLELVVVAVNAVLEGREGTRIGKRRD